MLQTGDWCRPAALLSLAATLARLLRSAHRVPSAGLMGHRLVPGGGIAIARRPMLCCRPAARIVLQLLLPPSIASSRRALQPPVARSGIPY